MLFLQPVAQPVSGAPEKPVIQLDLVTLFTHASWPVRFTIMALILCSTLVWIIAILKILQLLRFRGAALRFEQDARKATSSQDLYDIAAAAGGASAGARVVGELFNRANVKDEGRLRAVADRAIVAERRRARTLMWPLASIASASPFIGLFGTVYGIMDAFVRIGAAQSASLPVVAPAIGEALITTAIGLAAAIPAVIFYNAIDKWIADIVAELEASAAEWVALMAASGSRPRAADGAPG